MPVGVLSLLGSILALMARSFTGRDPVLTWLVLPVFSAALLAFAICIVFLGRAYVAQTYVYLPLLRALTDARETFLEYAQTMAGGEAEVLEDFENEFRRRIIAAADTNTVSNERRSKFLHWARIAWLCVLAFTFLCGVAVVVDQARFVMPTEQAPRPTQVQPASAPQKPSFPENRVIKEGRDPKTVAKK